MHPRSALAVLVLGAFVMGTAELMLVGILHELAISLDVSSQAAGTLVTGYALGLGIGGPLLTAATVRFERRRLLLLILVGYLAVTAVAVSASSIDLLLLARIAGGVLQGNFLAVAFGVAADLVPPAQMGRAIGAVISGISMASAVGVPLGTLLGERYGWRGAFVAVLLAGTVVWGLGLWLLPPSGPARSTADARRFRSVLTAPILRMLAVGMVLMGCQFLALTYLSPFLVAVPRLSGASIGLVMLLYGAGTGIGSVIGGWVADLDARAGLLVAHLLLVVAIGATAAFGAHPWAVAVAMAMWGLVGFGFVPSMQYRVMSLAGPRRELAGSLTAPAINVGIAAGATMGGWASRRRLTDDRGVPGLPGGGPDDGGRPPARPGCHGRG